MAGYSRIAPPRKRKERNITPSLFVLIEFTDPPSCCFHFVFITAAHMVAGAILRHDGWHAGWWVNIFEFIIVCTSDFWVYSGKENVNINTKMVYWKGNTEPSFSLSLPFYTFPYRCPVFNWLFTIQRSQSCFPGVLLTPPRPKKRNLKKG